MLKKINPGSSKQKIFICVVLTVIALTVFVLTNKEFREKRDSRVVGTQNDSYEYFNKKGNEYLKLGQYPVAIEYFNNAIRLRQDDADIYHNRATAYGQLGKYQQAIADYNESIRLKPNYADSYHNRGIIYLLLGNKELGCRDFQKACSLGNCKLLDLSKNRGDCR